MASQSRLRHDCSFDGLDGYGSRRKEKQPLSRQTDDSGLGSLCTSSIIAESRNGKLEYEFSEFSLSSKKSVSMPIQQTRKSLDTGYSSAVKGPVKEEIKEMLELLGAPSKLTDLVQRLLTYATVISNIKLPISVVKLATAGFVGMKTALGYRYGCPDCKIIFRDIPDQFDSPQAFHQFTSPNCPHVQKIVGKESSSESNTAATHDTSMEIDSGLGTSLAASQSLFTTNQDPGIAGASGFHDTAELGGQEGAAYSEMRKSKMQNILKSVEISTQGYTMRRPKLNRSLCVERNRRKTFKERHSLDTHITKKYASSGLHLTEEPKGKLRLMCAWCEFKVDFTREMATDKEVAKELLDKHVMDYHCDFITGREETMRNVPYLFGDGCWGSLTKHTSLDEADPGDHLSGLQINYQQAKHPGMAVFERRKDSFLTFPTDSTQQPDLLIEAGYFYASGKSDTVTCFMCGVVSSDWSINETPWQRHARSSTTCQHVMSQKGEEFVKSTLEEYGEYRERKRENRIHNVTTRMLRPRMDSIVVQTALMFGIKRDHIKTVVSNRIMAGDPDFTRLEDLVRAEQDLSVPPSHLHTDPIHLLPEVICRPFVPNLHEEEDDGTSDVDEFVSTTFEGNTETDESAAAERRDSEAKQKQEDLEAIKNFGVDIDIPQLRNQLTCKVCLTEPVGIIYIPCGHFVCCTSCAAAMTHCPMCRKDVNGTIKANFR